jgi:leucyl-tRNA synthetase
MIYCEDCAHSASSGQGWNPVPEKDLPILLPTDVDFLPHGESPIARSTSFQKDVVCPSCGKHARREVDTMDTYVDSSWYFLRFCDPKNDKEFAAKNKIIPVDDYVGGGHVVQHLLFARFFWKVLFDLGYIDKKQGDEPFLKLRAPGWILGPDSRKMSKRWGNVVTPDDIIPKFGADTLRLYEMFMGPFDIMKPWSIAGVEGSHRFLGRVWRLFQNSHVSSTLLRGPRSESASREAADVSNSVIVSKMHKTIKKVGEDIENYKFNTAISSIMEFVNTLTDYSLQSTEKQAVDRRPLTVLCQLLAPFAPHMMEEVWHEVLGQKTSIHISKWPEYDEKYLKLEKVTIAIQINGKLRATLTVDSQQSTDKEKVLKLAKEDIKVAKWLEDGIVKKEIFVPNKLVNFVI